MRRLLQRQIPRFRGHGPIPHALRIRVLFHLRLLYGFALTILIRFDVRVVQIRTRLDSHPLVLTCQIE